MNRSTILLSFQIWKDDLFICDEFIDMPVTSLDMSISWENTFVNEKNETQEFSANPVINKKVKIAVSGLKRTTQKYFITDIINIKDKELAADFIISSLKQDSVKPATRRVYVLALAYLCRYLAANQQKVSLDKVTADILYDYIDSFRPEAAAVAVAVALGGAKEKVEGEELDEEETRLEQQLLTYQSWMNTQKTLCRPLEKFYKWVAYPTLTTQKRKRLPRDK